MSKKDGFTLIEVMIAVMIISVVIASLVELRSQSSFLLEKTFAKEQQNSIATLLLYTPYGLQKESFSLDRTVEAFDLDDDLRRELKSQKVSVVYQSIKRIDLSEEEENTTAKLYIEIGKTTLQFNNAISSIFRISTQ